jgi:hypothetical protein
MVMDKLFRDRLVIITPLFLRISLIMFSIPTIINNSNEGLKFFLDAEYALKNMKSIFNMKGSII